jgi:hypothetical protein
MAARGAGKPAREKAVARPVREEEPQAAPSGSAHPASKKKRKKRT